MKSAKPYDIPKALVWDAYLAVKASGGGPGIDGLCMDEFEQNLKDRLYKIWNRLSSGSYLPAPVKQVDIGKADGGTRTLGIPTIEDRIAQAVAKLYLEPILEPHFHEDSYGGCDLDLMFGFSGVLASRTDRASPKIVATDLGSASTNVDSIQSPHPCLSSASPIGTSAV